MLKIGIIRTFYGYEDVSRRLWITSLILIGAGLFYLLMGLFVTPRVLPLMLIAAPGLWMLQFGYGKRIGANPPFVGLLTIWGKRIPVVIREGIWFLANFFPFYIWYIPIKVERDTYNIEFDILCKAEKLAGDDPAQVKDSIGGTVNLKMEITLAPDYRAKEGAKDVGGERLIQYTNSGKEKGVTNILNGVLKEEMRDIALDFTWERFAELKNVLSAHAISLITSERVCRLPVGQDGKPFSIKQLEERGITADTYNDRCERIEHLLDEYIAAFDAPTHTDEEKRDKKSKLEKLDAEIFYFLNTVVTAGVADVRDLGINITKFNITHIFPVGAIKAATEAAAAEKQQRTQEERDAQTENELAKIYFTTAKSADINEPITWDEALKRARVARGRAKEIIITGGTNNPIRDAAALMQTS